MKQVKFGVWEEWLEIWHANVSRPPSELISFRKRSVDFIHFGGILIWWNRSTSEFPGIFWKMRGKNGLEFGMLLYANYLEN